MGGSEGAPRVAAPDATPPPLNAPKGGLELRALVKRYPPPGGTTATAAAPDAATPTASGVLALDGVSLTISPGELVALYGPSGSGKTTLLLLAAGLLAPDQGSVRFDGTDLATLSPRQSALYRRRDVGFVFQSAHLVPGASALENAALKLLADGWTLREGCELARPWLQRVGLGERLEHPSDRLSAGERQRVAIARALAGGPRLLLADEPTGNLDSERSRQTLALLRELARERRAPVLLATHDPQAGAVADRVLTLRDGRLRDGLDLDLGVTPTLVAAQR
jgi:putative ABC transport system ATP-binding protein